MPEITGNQLPNLLYLGMGDPNPLLHPHPPLPPFRMCPPPTCGALFVGLARARAELWGLFFFFFFFFFFGDEIVPRTLECETGATAAAVTSPTLSYVWVPAPCAIMLTRCCWRHPPPSPRRAPLALLLAL